MYLIDIDTSKKYIIKLNIINNSLLIQFFENQN
jgi:hypothetical protein